MAPYSESHRQRIPLFGEELVYLGINRKTTNKIRKLSDMKKTITLLPLALIGLALSFTSCNNESRSELNGGETTLELSSSIAQNRVTTQSDQKTNHWDGNEQIGVYSTSLTASNVLYTATKAGASTDFTTQDPISIPYGTEQHDIKAYYPYDAAATTAVEFDLTKQNSQPLLYATGTVTNANPKLNLNFGHKLGKLRIKVETTNSLNPTEPVSKVSVNEVLTKGSLNIESGDFTVDNTVKANLDLKKQGEEFYTYLMPGESIKGKVIAIEHGGKVYKATLDRDKTVEAGKYYRYTISLSNGSAKIEDGSGTIDNEDEGDTGKVIGAPEEDTTPSAPVTATLTSTSSEYASGTLSAPVEGGSYTFTLAGLEAGTQVSAKADPAVDWITFSGDVTLRATADQTFTVKVEANETTEKRETTITLTAEGMNDLTFAVQQAAKEVTPEPEPPVIDEGDGTEANPYSVAQAISKQGEKGVYVKGYIIGAARSGKGGPKLIESSGTNIMLAESMDETDVAKMIPVQLPKEAASRDALNLADHPENKGKLVAVNGDLTAYFSAPGLKNVKEYKFL